jgi:hypothetical protein
MSLIEGAPRGLLMGNGFMGRMTCEYDPLGGIYTCLFN